MSTILRFEDENTKTVNKERVKQQRVIPVGTLLYTTSINLPKVLSRNTLLFTTDTKELYIGTDTGIARVNLGSDGEIIDKGDYLSKAEAAQYYVQKDYLDPESVVTDQEMKDYVAPLERRVSDIIANSEFKADKDNVFSKEESNAQFVSKDSFNIGMETKVDQELLTATGNRTFIKNLPSGLMLKFQNPGNDVESYVNVGKDKIVLYSKRTKDEEFGGRLYITPSGVYYTYNDNDIFGKDDELITMADLESIQDMYNTITALQAESKEMANRSMESAHNSEVMIQQTKQYIENAALQSQDAYNLAQDAFNTVQEINDRLMDAYTNSTSSLAKANRAETTAKTAITEAGEAITNMTQFKNSILEQFHALQSQVNSLIAGTIENEDTRKKIISVENLNDIYEVPYETEVTDLVFPAEIKVTLEDNTEAIVPVVWQRSLFQSQQIDFTQNIIGIIPDTDTVQNPYYIFAVCAVRVMPAQAESEPVSDSWEVTFMMPSMVDTIHDFNIAIGHPELTSEDLMGTLDNKDNYVNPTAQLFFIGTTKNVDTTLHSVQVLNPILIAELVNNTLTSYVPDGLPVPIFGIASDATIAEYETNVFTYGRFACNGAFSYSEGTLIFNNAIDANAVYVLRKSASIDKEG